MSEHDDSEERGGKIYPHPQYDGLGMMELAAAMEQVRVQLDAAKEEKSRLQKEYDYLTMAALPKAMGWGDETEEGEKKRIEKFRREGGRGITVYDKIFASVLAQNRLALHEWFKTHKLEDLVVETVNSSTLRAYVGRQIAKGEAYPADLIKVAIVPTAKFY